MRDGGFSVPGLLWVVTITLLVAAVAPQAAGAAETLSGIVVDDETGESVSWCAVLDSEGEQVFLTDGRGCFSVRVRELPAVFVLSHVAYETIRIEFTEADLVGKDTVFRLTPQVYAMPEVEVTGERVPFDPERSAAPVSIIPHERIARQNPINIGQVLTEVPGVEVAKTGPWSTKPVIRGMSGDRVLVLVDGRRLNQAQGHGAEPSMVDIESVERIEVYRGSSSALYGSDAMGGVINIVTRSHSNPLRKQGVSGSLKLLGRSADEQAYGRLDLHGMLGSAEYDLGLSGRSVGTLHTPEGLVPNTDFTDCSGDISVELPVWDEDRVRASLQHYSARDIGVPVFNDELESNGRYPLKERNSAELSYEFRPRAGSWSWLSRATASSWVHRTRSEFRQTAVDSLFFRDIHIGWSEETRDGDSALRTVGARLEATAVPWSELATTFGVEFVRDDAEGVSVTEEIHSNLEWQIVSVEEDSVASLPEARRTTISAFAQSEFELGARVIVSLGVRHDDSTTQTWETRGSNVEPGTTTAHRTSIKAGSRVQITDNVTVTGSFGTGFKVPTLQELYFNDIVHGGMWVFGNEELIIEDALSADVGVRFSNNGLSVRVDAFRTWTDNLIAAKYIGMLYLIPRFQYVNITEAVMEGVEVEAAWRVGEQIEMSGAWSWLKGDDLSDHGFGQPESIPLPSMPPAKATIQLSYTPQVEWGPFSGVWVEPCVRIVGDRVRVAQEEPTSAGFTLFDVRIGCDVGRSSELTLGVENLADKSYQEPLSFVREAGRNFTVAWRTTF